MIGVITQNAYENGYYEQALKIAKLVLTIVTSLGTVMIPRIGYHYSKGDTETVKAYMYRAYKFVWLCGIPLTFGLIAVSSNFVPWFFGDGYDKVVPLLGVLSFLILAIGINNVTGMQYLIPTKRENTFSATVIIGAVTNFVLNFFLIQVFQSTLKEYMLITNIQRFSLHDGPGIRTTIFLKGCSLRCPWCSNPENIKPYPEKYYKDGIEGIYGKNYTCDEVYNEIIKDRAFYDENGGVTFSGGEALLYVNELLPLLEKLKKERISDNPSFNFAHQYTNQSTIQLYHHPP